MEKRKQLSVENYHLEELRVTRNSAYRGNDETPPQPTVAIEFNAFTHKRELDRFAVSLCVKSQKSVTHPLRFSVRITGFFRLSEPLADHKLPAERVVNALTILYGIVRGHISTSAAWFNEPVIVPTVYFTDIVNAKIEAAKKHEIESAQPLVEATA